jgi:hypothetical protein
MSGSPLDVLKSLSDFPWDDAVDLIEAAQEADPDADVDELIADAAVWLDTVIDFTKFGTGGATLELFDHMIFESGLRLIYKSQSPGAREKRQTRRADRKAKRQALRGARRARRTAEGNS